MSERSALPPPRVTALSRRARYLVFALAAGVVFLLREAILQIVVQAALGVLVAAAALPLCARFEKRMGRTAAATLALLMLSALALGALLLLAPFLAGQIRQLAGVVPVLLERAQALAQSARAWLVQQGVPVQGQGADNLLSSVGAWLSGSVPGVLSRVGGMAGGISRMFLAPALAFYFLRDREILSYRLSLWVPLKHRRKVIAAISEMRREMNGFFRGQLLVSACVGVCTALGLLAVGVPAWLVLGLLMGVFELVPYIGPFLGAIPVLLFALPQGFSRMLWALAVVVAVQQLEGSLLSPRLMASSTGLHPVTVLLLISAGGLLGGVLGMLLALPAYLCVRGALRVLRAA